MLDLTDSMLMPQTGQAFGMFENASRDASLLLGCYLAGCFNAGYYLVRWRTGQDIRQMGSGNAGARNVGRLLGRSAFALTFLLDLAKGALAVWAARQLAIDERLGLLAMLAVVAGHIWPCQLRCRGGKGVATATGTLLVLDAWMVLALLVVAMAGFVLCRRTIASGLLAFALLPCLALGLHWDLFGILSGSALAVLVLIAHRRNLVEEITHLLMRDNLPENPNSSSK